MLTFVDMGGGPTVNEQGVLTDILIELTKYNKFGLKSPAIARHWIILNNICQFIHRFMENKPTLFFPYRLILASSSSKSASLQMQYPVWQIYCCSATSLI